MNAEGTAVTVSIDATAAGIEGFYNLVVTNGGGGRAAQIRVVPNRPVIDVFTPQRPSQDDVYVFAATGANLAGATLIASDPEIEFYDVETADDHILGFMHVLPGAASSMEVLVSSAAGSLTLPLDVMGSPDGAITANVVVGQTVDDPGLLVQRFAPLDVGEPGWHWEPPRHDPIYLFPCGGGRLRKTDRWRIAAEASDLVGRKGKELLEALGKLPLDQPLDLELEIVDITLRLELQFIAICEFSAERGVSFSDVDVCLTAEMRTEVIGLGSKTCTIVSVSAMSTGRVCRPALSPP